MAISNEQIVAALKKNPVVSTAIIICVGLAVAHYFRMDLTAAATTQLDERTKEGQRLAANIKNSAQLPEQLAHVSAAAKEVDNRLVRVGSLANNLQYFYKLEADTGVKLIDLRQTTEPSRTAKTGRFPVSFALTLHGEYPQVLDYLRRVESGSHYCRVRSANVVPFDAGAGSTGLRSDAAKLTLNLELLGVP